MKQVINNIRRNPYQTFAAALILAVTVFLTGIFMLASFGSNIVLKSFETKPQVIAYLVDSHEASQVALLTQELQQISGVKGVKYVSKQDALEIYKQSVSNDPLLLGSLNDWSLVTADILPASIEVAVTTRTVYEDVVRQLDISPLVSVGTDNRKEIDFPEDVVVELHRWTDAIRLAGGILVFILLASSLLTVMVIISLKLGNRKDEIRTLQLLGATKFFIIKPYLGESVCYGLMGGAFGFLLSLLVILYSSPYLSPWLSGIIAYPLPLYLYLGLAALQILLGVFISFISALFASIRFVSRR